MSGHVYKKIALVGSSPNTIEEAVDGAIARAAETLRNLDWFEITEVRGQVQDGKVAWYQVSLNVGFRVLDAADITREA